MEKYYYLVVPGGTSIKLFYILATSDNLVKCCAKTLLADSV